MLCLKPIDYDNIDAMLGAIGKRMERLSPSQTRDYWQAAFYYNNNLPATVNIFKNDKQLQNLVEEYTARYSPLKYRLMVGELLYI